MRARRAAAQGDPAQDNLSIQTSDAIRPVRRSRRCEKNASGSEIVQRPPPADVHVDDDELLRLLRHAGRPAGLVRSGERVLLTAAVVDPIERS